MMISPQHCGKELTKGQRRYSNTAKTNDILNSADKGKAQKEKVPIFTEPVTTFAEPTPDLRVQAEPRVEVH
jgi:hypothetical protein